MEGSMADKNWIEEEVAHIDLGDRRLNNRLVSIIADFSATPEGSIPQASGSRNAATATYRFFRMTV